MSDPTNPQTHADAARAEAVAWLAGQFQWEALLADLHELAEREAAPVVQLGQSSEASKNEDAA